MTRAGERSTIPPRDVTRTDDRGAIQVIRRYVRDDSESAGFATQGLVSGSLIHGAGVYLGVTRVLPGVITDEARHSTDEAVFVLSGARGELIIEGESVGEFGQDDSLLIKAGLRHEYRNMGPDVIEMVFFFPSPERPDIEL